MKIKFPTYFFACLLIDCFSKSWKDYLSRNVQFVFPYYISIRFQKFLANTWRYGNGK
jgi:hypothetical protein